MKDANRTAAPTRAISLALLVMVASLAVSSLADAAGRPQLRRDGAWLVDQYGRVVIVHGVNLVWKLPPYVPPATAAGFTKADARWLADHGFNGARIGVLWVGVSPDAPGQIDGNYLKAWHRVVKLLARRRVWMLFDFHQDLYNEEYQGEGIPTWALHDPVTGSLPPPTLGFPANYFTPQVSEAFDNLWANTGAVWDGFRDAWIAVAKRWRRQRYHMGYDLLNEPWSGQEFATCLVPGTGCPSTYTNELQPTFTHVLAGIRSVDTANLAWFEPELLAGGSGSTAYYTPVPGETQIGYSFHNYCPHGAILAALPIGGAPPGCDVFEGRVADAVATNATNLDGAPLMTEFGASDDVTDVGRVAALADQHLGGWLYWQYKNWSDPTTQSQTSGAQSLFTDDADLSSVKEAKARVLVRTYPRATAGTPLSLSFAPDTGAFHYVYAPRDLSRPTEIFVSPIHYPSGYAVQVTGGHVLTAPNASVIKIVADPGATQVDVQVAAAP